MKIEVDVIEVKNGEPTVLEFEGVLYSQHPPVKEKKPRYRNPNAFMR